MVRNFSRVVGSCAAVSTTARSVGPISSSSQLLITVRSSWAASWSRGRGPGLGHLLQPPRRRGGGSVEQTLFGPEVVVDQRGVDAGGGRLP